MCVTVRRPIVDSKQQYVYQPGLLGKDYCECVPNYNSLMLIELEFMFLSESKTQAVRHSVINHQHMVQHCVIYTLETASVRRPGNTPKDDSESILSGMNITCT